MTIQIVDRRLSYRNTMKSTSITKAKTIIGLSIDSNAAIASRIAPKTSIGVVKKAREATKTEIKATKCAITAPLINIIARPCSASFIKELLLG